MNVSPGSLVIAGLCVGLVVWCVNNMITVRWSNGITVDAPVYPHPVGWKFIKAQ